jgi:quinol monooxygenase YgiN
MTDYVWIVKLTIKAGQFDNFKTLTDEMVRAIQENEPGTLNYELFISPDKASCHIYEQYADAQAFKAHLDNFNQLFASRFAAAVDVGRFTVYGDPNDEIRAVLAGFGAVIMMPLVGFRR